MAIRSHFPEDTMHTTRARHDVHSRLSSTAVGILILTVLLAGCQDASKSVAPTRPRLTLGSGLQATVPIRATFSNGVNIGRESGNWRVQIKASPNLDVAVQTIDFQPGGHTGWHMHPGPVFVLVASGTVTFYDSDDPDCKPTVRTAGQGYLDGGRHAHIARNEATAAAQVVATYFAAPSAPLRIDAADPGHCPF